MQVVFLTDQWSILRIDPNNTLFTEIQDAAALICAHNQLLTIRLFEHMVLRDQVILLLK